MAGHSHFLVITRYHDLTVFWDHLTVYWDHFTVYWDHLTVYWELGPSNSLLGPSNGLMGPSNILLGPSYSLVGPSNRLLGPSNSLLGPSYSVLGPSNRLLGPSTLNSLLGPSNSLATRVLGMQRSLARKGEIDMLPNTNLGTPSNIIVISTFGSDSDLVKSVKQFESVLSRTRSFSTSDAFSSPTPTTPVSRTTNPTPTQTKKPSLFSFVKKTGPSIRSKVVKTKNLALGKHRNCALCPMISSRERYRYNNKTVKTAEGSCDSYNVVYLVVCSICWKHYVGRTCRHLRARIGEHRRYFLSNL